jgi:nucleoside-diphosphate-sugar epimerase
MEERKKVLIAGDLGVVGFAAAKHFSRLPRWDVVGISRRTPQRSHGGEHVSVDLQDKEQCTEVFSQMQDITHVIYAALYEKPGLIPGWSEPDQMETNLNMLQNLVEPLERAATNLEHFILMQGTKAYGVHVEPMKLPGKESEPRHSTRTSTGCRRTTSARSRRMGAGGAGRSCVPRSSAGRRSAAT